MVSGEEVSSGTAAEGTSPSCTACREPDSVEQPVGRDTDTVARQGKQMVSSGDRRCDPARERYVERVRRGLGAAETHHESQVMMAVRANRAAPKRSGNVQGDLFALAYSVLAVIGGVLAGACGVWHGCGVAEGEDIRVSWQIQVLVNDQPAVLGRKAKAVHERVGSYPDTPDQ